MKNNLRQQILISCKLRIWLTILISLGSISQMMASHSAGADLKLTCLGGLRYAVTLNFYVDCAGNTPLTLVVGGYGSTSCGTTVRAARMRQRSVTEVSQLCNASLSNSTCNGGTLPGFRLYIYSDTITLPMQCTDWKFFYQVSYRNAAITNIGNPGNTRFYVETTLDNVNAPCNSNPDFTTPLVPYICSGIPFNYNHGAVDPDGDSLAYSLITPLGTGGAPLTFIAPFTTTQPMSTTGAFNFDNATGQMSFTPNGTQISITAVEVREYRNGLLIGRTVRDMQIIVLACSNNPPIPSPLNNLSGATQSGNTLTVCGGGNTVSFSITANDADALDSIFVANTIMANLPGATVNVTGNNSTTINVNWPMPASPSPFYSFAISFEDNACPLIASQTVGYNVVVDNCLLLPVTCANFKTNWNSQTKAVNLSWTLASEEQNNGFFIERSSDGYTFETVNWIPSKGTNVPMTYHATDDQIPYIGAHYYYRIRQVDEDGTSTYVCRIQEVYIPDNSIGKIAVYPKPTKDELTLSLESTAASLFTLKIYNVLGVVVQEKIVVVKMGLNTYSLSLGKLPSATYYLRIEDPEVGLGNVIPLIKQ